MLERYFSKPSTLDRIRSSWFAAPIEHYVEWLAVRGFSASTIRRRVSLLCRFADFVKQRRACSVAEAGLLVDAFVAARARSYGQRRPGVPGPSFAKDTAVALRQAIRLATNGDITAQRAERALPFEPWAPGFFPYLREERGLKPATVYHYRHYLNRLAAFLARRGITSFSALSPALLAAFVVESATQLGRTGRRDLCGCTRVLLRYCYREGFTGQDLSGAVEMPQSYRLASVPRSISWEEVRRVLALIDRRTARGRRDYAILLLLVTYGLRGQEIAMLTLDDLDWKRDRLHVRARKAGHSTVYPLAAVVGEAIVDYLKHGRPASADRHVFFRAVAPCQPISAAAVSASAAQHLRAAGVQVYRAGSHTLRHTCIQRLVDAELPLKTIGDYVGHRSPDSTAIYAKTALASLRAVAMGDGEAL